MTGWQLGLILLGVFSAAFALFVVADRWASKYWCTRCGGKGTYIGHSPLAPLNSFRPAVTLTCYHCDGSGKEPKRDTP